MVDMSTVQRLRKPLISAVLPALAVGLILAAAFFLPSARNMFGKIASCSAATLTAAPPSPHTGGGTVVETATATCHGGSGYAYGAGTPEFRFWEFDPGSRWSMVQDYSVTNTFNWNTTGLANGDYRLEVDVRSIDESVAYDVVVNITYHIGPAPCTAANLTVAPASPGHTGGTYTMTGSSASCPNPVYRFWVQDPGRAWSIVQDYTATTTHTWGPVGTYHVGDYNMEVDVRDASETTAYDTVKNIVYHLAGCTGATLTPVPNGGVHGAVPVTLTATATCPGTATYRFWIFDAGGTRWSMVQDFSTSNTYTWAAGNQKAGTSRIEVDVRDQGSLDVYEFATSGLTDTLT
jgi:N-acetylmuramoyl-L-alanine amidase